MVKLEGGAGPGRNRRVPGEPRHRSVCAPRAEAAVGAQGRRLSRAGARGSGGRADDARRAGAGERGRGHRVARMHSGGSSAQRSRESCTCRSSASARGRTPTARSWCSTTCSTSPPGASRSSRRISWPAHDSALEAVKAYAQAVKSREYPGRRALLLTARIMQSHRPTRRAARARAQWRRERRARRVRADDGQSARGPRQPGRAARASSRIASSSASSSIRCSSVRTRISPRIRARRMKTGTLLESLRVDLLFVPEVADMYPRGQESTARVHVPELEDILCGAFRPGHFMGVATVVTKLLNLVQPDVAVFGEKDYQQLLIIRRAATDLCMPMEIIGVPTIARARRPGDELAQSLPVGGGARSWRRASTPSCERARVAIECRRRRFRGARSGRQRSAPAGRLPPGLLLHSRCGHVGQPTATVAQRPRDPDRGAHRAGAADRQRQGEKGWSCASPTTRIRRSGFSPTASVLRERPLHVLAHQR